MKYTCLKMATFGGVKYRPGDVVEAENSQFYAMKRDFRRVWNYFGAEKMQQVIGLMREQEQTTDRSQKKNRQNNVEL